MNDNRIKKAIFFNVIVTCTFLLVAGSFAAYTSLSKAKRVVSTVGAQQLFSSNILTPYDTSLGLPSARVISFGAADSTSNSFTFVICNYAQGDKTTVSAKEITYTLEMHLLDAGDNEINDEQILLSYTLNDQSVPASGLIIQGSLPGRSLSEDQYTVSVPYEHMNECKILLTAKATNVPSYTTIGRIISTTETVVSSHWTGNFSQQETEQSPSKLEAINIKIQGTEQETMVIKWNTVFVEIDPWFLLDIDDYIVGKPDSAGIGWKTLKMKVGEAGQPNQYRISFFRTRSFEPGEEEWDDIKAYFQFSYEP